jgi:hypothetical protein
MRRAGITPVTLPTAAEVEERKAQAATRDALRGAVIAWAAATPATDLIANLDVGKANGAGYELDRDDLNVIDGASGEATPIAGIPTLTTPTIIRVDALTPSGHPITVAITATITPRS